MKYLFAVLMISAGLAISAAAQDQKAFAEITAASSTQVVKGAPFTAEALSESVQTLADGNKLTRRTTMRLYRDSSGRFRREGMPNPNVNLGAFPFLDEAVFIFDPVAGVRFLLNSKTKTARRVDLSAASPAKFGGTLPATERKRIEMEAMEKSARQKIEQKIETEADRLSGSAQEESLGTRVIEGLEAEGTRSTQTLAAGAVGNEKPISIVYERWYSKELQMIVLSRHSDPRFGEQTYRLTNITRKEPERALFSPPADYRLIDEPPGARKQ